MTETYISTPHKGVIYIIERARKGSSKLIASAMPANQPVGDEVIPIRRVPFTIRRAAKRYLFGENDD